MKKAPGLALALIGGETLLGKEVSEVLKERGKAESITSYAATGEGNFADQSGEAVYIEPLTAEAIRGKQAILVAGAPEGAQKAYELAKAAGGKTSVIDCTGYLEEMPEARILAPLVTEPKANTSWLLTMAHPAASSLALVLTRLARYRAIRQSVVHVFEPASERGQKGLTELHQQTTGLLAFKTLEKEVFDAQVSFNLLPQLGEDAQAKLARVEARIDRHVATILSSDPATAGVPMPSVRVVQAPVFHGYSISVWVEFEADVNAAELGEALASAQIEVRAQGEEPPNNVEVAGQSGLIAGDIRIDHNHPRAAWLWVAGDNLRLMADAVADVVSQLNEEMR